MKIADIRATIVTIPLEAPLQHASGAHWGRFVRTIVEVETDDGLVGFEYEGGSIKVPDVPGLGVSLDRDKLDEYAELYKELGGYPYDRDPGYPGRYPLVPKQRFADPDESITPQIPTGQPGRSSGAEVK